MTINASGPSLPPLSRQRRRRDVAHFPRRRWRKTGLRRSAEGPRFIACWCGRLMTALLNLIRPTCQLRSPTICQRGASKVGHAGAVERLSRQRNDDARSLTRSPGDSGSDGRERRNWVDINRLLLLLLHNCQILFIHSIRDIDEVYLELLAVLCIGFFFF